MIVTEQLLDWIRVRLVEKSWTVADFARETKTTRTGWVRILAGETKSLSAKAVGDLCRVFQMTEMELYKVAHPAEHLVVRELSGVYSPRDPLLTFICGDLSGHPEHRPAYEAVATAFGYREEGRA